MIPSFLDFTSDLFDPYKALYSTQVYLPYPKAKTYNNLAEYYSHTFLKKGLESDKPPKKQQLTRERNYEWYYDTLGLSEFQRNRLRRNKKIKRRKGKKPVSVVTIPGSPLRSEKVTVCQSNFKEYCRRKYKLLNNVFVNDTTKSEGAETFPSQNTSESSVTTTMETELPYSSLSYITCKASEFQPSSINTFFKTDYVSSLPGIKSEAPELLISSHVKTEPSELMCEDSNDSFSDDVLILKMKSNVKKIPLLPLPTERKDEPSKLSTESKHSYFDLKYVYEPLQTTNDRELSKINISGELKCPNDDLNNNSNIKSTNTLNDSENTSSVQVENSSGSIKCQKIPSKKNKKSNGSEKKSEKRSKNSKHKKKKQKCDKSIIENVKDSNILDGDLLKKSSRKKISPQEKSIDYKENLSIVNHSKSDGRPIKKPKKSTLKSQENVPGHKKITSMVKIDSKLSKKKISPMIDHCTCKVPSGLFNLCSCGFYARAKEKINKFKIPRKKN